jgi:hypothetical protein
MSTIFCYISSWWLSPEDQGVINIIPKSFPNERPLLISSSDLKKVKLNPPSHIIPSLARNVMYGIGVAVLTLCSFYQNMDTKTVVDSSSFSVSIFYAMMALTFAPWLISAVFLVPTMITI